MAVSKHKLLMVVLLLALLFSGAAASPAIDPALPTPAMESCYGDSEGILNGICEYCTLFSMEVCTHVFASSTQCAQPAFATEWSPEEASPVLDTDEPAQELEAQFPASAEADRHPLVQRNVRQLEENATTIQLSTIQIHVDDTYTPGDHLQAAQDRSRRPSHRRQAPRPGGFPCTYQGCSARPFDRSCDLKRHQKTHLLPNERPHKCSVCDKSFLYPKDRNRHERTHINQSSSSQPVIYYCLVDGCSNTDGFSRHDNLLRHQRRQHPSPFPTL